VSAPSTARQPSGRDRRRAPSTARGTGPVLILLAGLVVVAALCSIAFGARVVGLEEILVVTYAHDAVARRRSYELLAAAW